jgi:KR domain/Polyketide synthase dehydratase
MLQSFPRKNVAVATCGKRSNDQNAAFLKAIASLFEMGITPDFGKLLAHRSRYGGHMSSLPTYPFQRQRYYPSSIPSRNSPSFPPPLPQTNSSSAIPFHVDQSLCDLLLGHRIEGHRVAPGASLVDFFAKLCPAKSVKTIKFNAPLVLDVPDSHVFAEFTSEHHFVMYGKNTRTNMICSGITAVKTPQPHSHEHISLDLSEHPDQVLTKDEAYSRFKGVDFGPAFRNIQEYRQWSSHADCIITVEPTEHPTHDRIRKLDSCLHMFGIISFQEVPRSRDLDGVFLPTALEDFTLHSDELPTSFICRYYLPLDMSRNYHVFSAGFDVFSLSGALLVSCRKYSVAWIPTGTVIQDKQHRTTSQPSADIKWLQQSWVARDLPPPIPVDKLEVLCISDQAHSRIPSLFDQMTWQTHLLNLHDLLAASLSDDKLQSQLDGIIDRITGTSLLVMVDITSNHASPTSEAFYSSYRHILSLMKLLISSKVRFTSLVLISEMSVAIGDEGDSPSMTPTAGSLIQGMLRVFRREMGLDEVIWGLDLPPVDTVEDSVILDIISDEIYSRLRGMFTDRTVAYRHIGGTQGLSRLVPVLQTTDNHSTREVSGTSIIVGLGSIGHALAPSLAGRHGQIIFIGRRHPDDHEVRQGTFSQHPRSPFDFFLFPPFFFKVQEELLQLQSKTDGRCAYMQADVCDFDSLRTVVTSAQALYGPIENIVHTAAVISDATIQKVTNELFELVLRPKVIGAWNLHTISEELKLPLKSFVLLSSVRSVPSFLPFLNLSHIFSTVFH